MKLIYFAAENAPYQSAEAFSDLFERTNLIVYRYLYALHGEPQEDVEDLWLETFLRAWRARQRFNGDESAAIGWLLQIARNLVIDSRRRQQRNNARQQWNTDLLPALEESVEARVIVQEQYDAVIRLLSQLPDKQRELIILRHVLGWTVKQISQHLQMRENTVSVTLRRTLQQLVQQQENTDDQQL